MQFYPENFEASDQEEAFLALQSFSVSNKGSTNFGKDIKFIYKKSVGTTEL